MFFHNIVQSHRTHGIAVDSQLVFSSLMRLWQSTFESQIGREECITGCAIVSPTFILLFALLMIQ